MKEGELFYYNVHIFMDFVLSSHLMDFVLCVSLFYLRQSKGILESKNITTHPMHLQTRDQTISLEASQSQSRRFSRVSMTINVMEGKRQSTSARSRDSGFESMSEETVKPGRLSIFLLGPRIRNQKS